MDLTRRQEYIEATGQMFDATGVGKTPGRIWGLLVIANPPYMTMKEIAEELDMAKSTISVALNMLTTIKFVEKFGLPGERADFYRINVEFLKKAGGLKNQAIKSFRDLLGEALDIIDEDVPQDHVDALIEIYEFYKWLDKKYPEIFEEWDRVWDKMKKEREIKQQTG